MKKTVWNIVRAEILVAAVAFALILPDIRVVKAAGCPDASEVGNNCTFNGGYSEQIGDQTRWTCFYTCYGGYGGGGEHMYIEQTVYVYD